MNSDYVYWLRLKGLSIEDDSATLRLMYSKSKRIGQHERLYDIRRRKTFGPGKYHASTTIGVYTNKNFVKGWRGVNPVNP